MNRTTLDIDWYNAEHLNHIIQKILRCSYLYSIETEYSPSTNGYHVILWCDRKCPICRLCYDDANRYKYDEILRPPEEQNVLFSKYTIKNLNL